MKKTLLTLSAVLLAASAVSAQPLAGRNSVKAKAANAEARMASPIEKSMALSGRQTVAMSKEATESQLSSVVRAPRKTVQSGLWYKRPTGSFLVSSTQTATNKYTYLVYPPFTDLTFQNMSTDKTATTWTIGKNTVDATGENNDLVESFSIPAAGYVNYNPTLNSGEDSFTWGESVSTDNYGLPVDTIYSLTQVNRNGGYYSGFTNGYVFGTNKSYYVSGTDTLDCYCSYITEFFDKPAAPFYLTNIWFHFTSDSQRAIPEGTDMKLRILKVGEDGKITDEELASMTFNMNDTAWTAVDAEGSYGVFMVSQKSTDIFGAEVETPVIIDDEFVVRIEGFNQPGVDFSLYMANALACTENNWANAKTVYPTIYTYVNAEGEVVASRYQYNSTAGNERQFNAVMYLDGMFDVVNFYDDFVESHTGTVGAEGGAVGFAIEETNSETGETETKVYPDIMLYTTLPWISNWEDNEGEENYGFEELPEWISVERDDSYAQYHVTDFMFTAEPLPDGVEERTADIHIVSDKGADLTFSIVQSAKSETGVSAVKHSIKAADAATYNVAGQRVNDTFKGLVIKNGKKVVLK